MAPHPFGVHDVYPIFVGLAVLVALLVTVRLAREAGLSLPRILVIQVTFSLIGVLGASVYNMIESGGRLGLDQMFGSGLRYPGGLLAVLACLPLLRLLLPAHVSFAAYLDILTPGVAFAMAFVRIGCFLQGCCFGTASALPWAMSFPPASQAARVHASDGLVPPGAPSLPVHPLQIYFGLTSLAIGLWLLRFRRRKRYDGQVFLLFLLLHEGSKGLLEFLRGSAASHSVVHLRVVSLSVAALAGAALLLTASRREAPRGS